MGPCKYLKCFVNKSRIIEQVKSYLIMIPKIVIWNCDSLSVDMLHCIMFSCYYKLIKCVVKFNLYQK